MIERCNNTSVGVLVERSGAVLLIERRKYPFGFAPPAGHVDDGESFPDAASRELAEEVGLTATALTPITGIRSVRRNRCRRPGGDWHQWVVYHASVTGDLATNPSEVVSARWVGPEELEELACRTRAYLAGEVPEEEWGRSPGLEPVWLEMLTEARWATKGRDSGNSKQ